MEKIKQVKIGLPKPLIFKYGFLNLILTYWIEITSESFKVLQSANNWRIN
jgi:hypothetical protein